MSNGTHPPQAGHGINTGNGYFKGVIIDKNGAQLDPVVFPAAVAHGQERVAGAIGAAPTVRIGETPWWVGEHAVLTGRPITNVSQSKLLDRAYLPAIVREAYRRMNSLNGSRAGCAVAGLPASWCGLGSTFEDGQHRISREAALGARLREAWGYFSKILVVPEPLALIFALSLDNNGQETGALPFESLRVGVVDWGYGTVDVAVVQNGVPLKESLDTWNEGMIVPLRAIRAHLSAHFERDITLHQADAAIRDGRLKVGGAWRDLPFGWDRPLLEQGEVVVGRLRDRWGRAGDLDAIVLGGGGYENPIAVNGTIATYTQAQVAEQPQIAIALGMARRARRLAVFGK